jgi:hypothetical protein
MWSENFLEKWGLSKGQRAGEKLEGQRGKDQHSWGRKRHDRDRRA